MGRSVLFWAMSLVTALAWGGESSSLTRNKEIPKAIIEEVDACCRGLGARDFKDRRKAANRLVELASVEGTYVYRDTSAIFTPKTPSYTVNYFIYRDYITKKLKSLFDHDDPEVSEGARDVFQTIDPLHGLDSYSLEIVIHVVGPHDTLESIAKTYDSYVPWIKKLNREISSDWSLRRFREIKVPARMSSGGMVIEIGE